MGKVPGTFFLRPCLLPFAGFGVPMEKVAYLGAASLSTITDAKDVNQMPNIDIATPASSALVSTNSAVVKLGPIE